MKAWASSGEAFPLADHRILFLESTRYTYLHERSKGLGLMPPGFQRCPVCSPCKLQGMKGPEAAEEHSSIS